MADAAIEDLDLNVALARVPPVEPERSKRRGRILGGIAESLDHGDILPMEKGPMRDMWELVGVWRARSMEVLDRRDRCSVNAPARHSFDARVSAKGFSAWLSAHRAC
jgi:hypothetical protein